MSYEFSNDIMWNDLIKISEQLLGPTEKEKEEFICNSHFTLCPVDKNTYKQFEPYLEHEYDKKHCFFMNICIDGKKINDIVYFCRIDSLDYFYSKIKDYNKKKSYFEFFTRCNIAQYTQEEVNKYNSDYDRYHYSGKKRTVGQYYLQKTDVIINLKTGEEVTFIDIPTYNRGYIMYDKYYSPNGEHKLISLETGNVIEYDYGDKIETDNHVILNAKRNDYKDPVKAIVLNKDTGDVTYID